MNKENTKQVVQGQYPKISKQLKQNPVNPKLFYPEEHKYNK